MAQYVWLLSLSPLSQVSKLSSKDASADATFVASIHLGVSASSLLLTNIVSLAASVLPLVQCFVKQKWAVAFVASDSDAVCFARFLRLALGVFYGEEVSGGKQCLLNVLIKWTDNVMTGLVFTASSYSTHHSGVWCANDWHRQLVLLGRSVRNEHSSQMWKRDLEAGEVCEVHPCLPTIVPPCMRRNVNLFILLIRVTRFMWTMRAANGSN